LKKLLVCAAISLGALLPATGASATEAGPSTGVAQCGPGYLGAYVWVYNYDTGQRERVVEYCIPIGP
jgi:hypothetical protein